MQKVAAKDWRNVAPKHNRKKTIAKRRPSYMSKVCWPISLRFSYEAMIRLFFFVVNVK